MLINDSGQPNLKLLNSSSAIILTMVAASQFYEGSNFSGTCFGLAAIFNLVAVFSRKDEPQNSDKCSLGEETSPPQI